MNKLFVPVFVAVYLIIAAVSCKKPKPEQSVKYFTVTNFNQIEASGLLDIQVIRSQSFSVKAEGIDISSLKVEVKNGKLIIGYGNLQLKGAVKITVAMPQLDAFYFNNRVKAIISGFAQVSEVEGELRNYSTATVQMNVSQYTVEAIEHSELILRGQAEKVYAAAENNSSVNAYSVASVFGRALANKNSTVKINVSNTLNASATERSTIYFKGNPQNRFTSELDNSKIIEE